MKKLSILVIDDEEAVRNTICENLEDAGFETFEAMDGEQGLQLIEAKGPPDVIITDIIMPQKEGLETIIEVRKKYPDVKIIAISGGGRTKALDFLELAGKLGATATMPKPLDLDELERTVRDLAQA
jgi:CheY-like chemotaxis protein